jgi:hypothetical protein
MPPEEPDFFVICARSGRFVFTSRFFQYSFPARSDPNFGSGGTSPPGHARQAKAEEGESHNKRAAINTGLPPGGLAPPEAEVQKRQARGNTSMVVREERPCGLTSRHF